MRSTYFLAASTMLLAATPAFSQNSGPAGGMPVAANAAKPAIAHTAKPATAASTPESRSAAALALSHEPTYDEGTAQRIKEAALSYSDIAVRGGWPTIPADAKFATGVAGPHDDLLRRRLIITEDLAADKTSGPFDEAMAEAIKHFQVRHGLAATATVTPRTLAALNISVQKRIRQLEASLERLENMNFSFGQRYVVVNLPATFAEAVENDKVVRRYRVIVGKTEKPSPTLTAEITSVNLNPTWTVPSSIAKTEISAHMRKDPSYLSRMHMEVLDGHDHPIDPACGRLVRQPHAELHGAPAERQLECAWSGQDRHAQPLFGLYARHQPAQSLQRRLSFRLPRLLARRQRPRSRHLAVAGRNAEMESRGGRRRDRAGAREDIVLPKKVPVAWIYLTAWMTRDQTVQFRNDIYAQDEQLLEATAEEAAFFNQAANHPLTAHLAR